MQGFSTVDGFAEITENLADMIKFVANEPSVGLFYVQQHVQNAAPNLFSLKNNVAERSKHTALHTEDMEDSISMVRSMKETGFSITEEMIRDIKNSLSIISPKQPKRGSLNRSSSGFLGRTTSWSPTLWGRGHQEVEKKNSSYLSSVFFKTSKTTLDDTTLGEVVGAVESSSAASKEESEEDLPLSISTEVGEEESQLSESLSHQQLISSYVNYDEFKADKEAKLEEWLGSEHLNKV